MPLRSIPPGRFVVVADSGTARLLHASGAIPINGGGNIHRTAALNEVARMERPSARLRGRALTTDRPGRFFDRSSRSSNGPPSTARHGAQSDENPQDVEIQRFAKSVARRLDTERRSRPMQELVVIAAPRFLGVLRPQLSSLTRGLVSKEIPRDLAHSDDAPILRAAFTATD
jgi:protein required for attachment to host cells